MKIILRLIATGRLDPTMADGVRELDLEGPVSLQQALENSGLPETSKYVTLVNDGAVAIADRGARMLNEGDTITVFPPIQGG